LLQRNNTQFTVHHVDVKPFFVAMQRKPVDGESQTRRIVKAEKAIRLTKATDHRETGSRFDGKFLNSLPFL